MDEKTLEKNFQTFYNDYVLKVLSKYSSTTQDSEILQYTNELLESVCKTAFCAGFISGYKEGYENAEEDFENIVLTQKNNQFDN